MTIFIALAIILATYFIFFHKSDKKDTTAKNEPQKDSQYIITPKPTSTLTPKSSPQVKITPPSFWPFIFDENKTNSKTLVPSDPEVPPSTSTEENIPNYPDQEQTLPPTDPPIPPILPTDTPKPNKLIVPLAPPAPPWA